MKHTTTPTRPAALRVLVPVHRTGARDHHLDEFHARQHQRMRLAGWPIPQHRADLPTTEAQP